MYQIFPHRMITAFDFIYWNFSLKMLSETQEDKNPFNKDLTVNTNDQALTNQLFLNCLKNIPKIGEKNAQLVAKSYKS